MYLYVTLKCKEEKCSTEPDFGIAYLVIHFCKKKKESEEYTSTAGCIDDALKCLKVKIINKGLWRMFM